MAEFRQKKIYDSCAIFTPDGVLLCLVTEKKARWYLKRDLGVEVACPYSLGVRLKFEPNGRGHAGDDFYLQPRPNTCAGCGAKHELTLHHIVPINYRRYFPAEVKGHSSHDLVPLCVECHQSYETAAMRLKQKLAQDYGAPLTGTGYSMDPLKARVKKAASALLRNSRGEVHIPPERLAHLAKIVAELFPEGETAWQEAADIDIYEIDEGARRHGQLVVERLADLQAFIELWRKHFLETVKPAFMPAHWRVDRGLNPGPEVPDAN